MRRIVWLVVAMFCLTLATSVVAKPKAAKVRKVSEKMLIKRVVLGWDSARSKDKPLPLSRAKFAPIKIADGWAVADYELLDSRGRIIPADGPQYILKKTNGKWRVINYFTEYNLEPKYCKQIGLSKATAKKLGITTESFD